MTAETPVQIIQKSTGPREFGTEVVTSPDSSIAAILSVSPSASTSASINVEVFNK
ncbi:MAG: malate:quinone oxidoreductase [Opitutae bacterium]|nr:malate:quinone oxidoreductase [Opitutae bacterium]MDG2345314.1 malate:quinone oxidoreductase [Opitutae bacterium]